MAFSQQTIQKIGEYHDQLRQFLLPHVHHNAERANDLAQDAALTALIEVEKTGESPDDVPAFMQNVAMNILKAEKNARKAEPKSLPLELAENAAETNPDLQTKGETEALYSIINTFDRVTQMGERYIDLFVLRYVEDVPDEKIMAALSMTPEEFSCRVEWLEQRLAFLKRPAYEDMQLAEEQYWHDLDERVPIEAVIKKPREIIVAAEAYQEPGPAPNAKKEYVM